MKNFLQPIILSQSSRLLILIAMLMILAGCEQTPDSASVQNAGQLSDTSPVDVKQVPITQPNEDSSPSSAPFQKMETKKVVDVSAFWDDALNGKIEAVRGGLEAGVDVNATDDQQRTALLFAAFNGHTSVAKLLLDQGASLGHRDAAGRTALMFAASGPNAETVELLLNAGSEVNAVDTDEKFTALMHAAAEGQLKVVEVLLKHEADTTLKDEDGDTARDFAARNGHADVVRLLSK